MLLKRKKGNRRPGLHNSDGGQTDDLSDDTTSSGETAEVAPPLKTEDCEAVEEGSDLQEQEEALIALIDYRAKEVDQLRKRTAYYRSQLEEAEKGLIKLHSKLARLRYQNNRVQQSKAPAKLAPADNGYCSVKPDETPGPSAQTSNPLSATQSRTQSRPQILIPAVRPKPVPPPIVVSSSQKPVAVEPTKSRTSVKIEVEEKEASPEKKRSTSLVLGSLQTSKQQSSSKKRPCPGEGATGSQDADGARKKSAAIGRPKESVDLISSVRTSSSPSLIRLHSSTHIASQHSRRLRCLAINPANDQLFFASALDGIVNLWQLQASGSSATLLSNMHCGSAKGRWPEDIAWHPEGHSFFSAYTADGGDTQVSEINLNASCDNRITFLESKPHTKGVINNIQFMPWSDVCFVTGGSDHAVVVWHEKKNGSLWKPEMAHKNLHSSGVSGVAGLQQKKMIVSVGFDKRIVGFDVRAGRASYNHQLECKCMSVLPSPVDFNLFMVQAGSPGKQLRLFDIRLRQTELHSFGWKQESSESQSALINQAWSPDGFYISSGSADPMIHIFDIRYNGHSPAQSVQAHQKRVFKAAWHHSLPLLISISSDLNIGLHKLR